MAQVFDPGWGSLNEQTVLLRMAGDEGRLDDTIVVISRAVLRQLSG